ncbi:MAG TPA: CBS domain-containing protein [Candidatus Dormibacteraeota bacterium]|nr:CBS domain-containing protein [Candidatus Dormibacteraeota bacterium]
MSPRAAWRLESLGYSDVYDYTAGKLDWMAAGLLTEGTNASLPRAGDLARKDVPTCTPEEKLGAVRDRVHSLGWDAVVVLNAERIVFGLLRARELALDGDQEIARALRPAPSTFRPYVLAKEMARRMVEHKLESSPITTSDGRLVGLLLQKDVIAAAESGQ